MSKAREVSLFISHWHAQLPSFPKGTLWNFNWHHSMCWVLMSISQTVFNSLAASLLTPTRHFKGALLWIPQSCIKNVNLGDMLTTRPCMFPNSNEDSDHSRQGRKEESTMPSARLSIWPSASFSPWTSNLHAIVFTSFLERLLNQVQLLKMKSFSWNTTDIYCKESAETYTELFVLQCSCLHIVTHMSNWQTLE